ncbi:hypothetical protein CAEBREN_19728 [Caenorhabditis brenneri]|uniref:Uncharacterized protein n=1 Tax=Caenorhabditis brenneri TaxID=135651 RepID=G0P512_CAEBE|nr:hypothetical protein CAEBREN_19728 [Caenorhabditis brenneri]
MKEVLSLASLWTAGVAKNRCLEFLSSDQCQMDLKAKFQMACELKLVEYLDFLLEGIHDAQTINPLITEEAMILDQPLIGVIFKKFFELCRNVVPYKTYKEGTLYSGIGASKSVKTLEGTNKNEPLAFIITESETHNYRKSTHQNYEYTQDSFLSSHLTEVPGQIEKSMKIDIFAIFG